VSIVQRRTAVEAEVKTRSPAKGLEKDWHQDEMAFVC